MKTAVVTGAAGYIASHLISQLLEEGFQVRGTVRSLSKVASHAHLKRLAGASERLALFEADLLADGAFDQAFAGVDYVFHMASPFAMNVEDPQRDLVDPAVKGTVSALSACVKSGTVKRVVLTSSMAAITDEPDSDHVLTEKDWNTRSTLDRNPYYLSKMLAEKEAWNFVEQKKPSFDLVTINPFIVIGPSIGPTVSESNQMFVDLVNGVYPGIMNLTWGFVDVRDVAKAHLLALGPKASGRYLCAAGTLPMREVVELMAKNGYDKYKLPKMGMDCAAGDYAVKLSSYLQPKGIGSYLRTHVGRVPRYDNSKIRNELGLQFRDVRTTILETLADLSAQGHIK
ncbi:MAG TPA: SDR family oxidoreductase [Polyangium sp.]|nr:SDR family oxidoreductase [Polyangium sp.]